MGAPGGVIALVCGEQTFVAPHWRDGAGPATHMVSLWGIAKRAP